MRTRVVPLSDIDADLTERWRQLGRDAVEPNPFLSPDFVLPAARRLDRPGRIALVAVDDGDELRFALPVVRMRRFRGIPVPAVGTWLHTRASPRRRGPTRGGPWPIAHPGRCSA